MISQPSDNHTQLSPGKSARQSLPINSNDSPFQAFLLLQVFDGGEEVGDAGGDAFLFS